MNDRQDRQAYRGRVYDEMCREAAFLIGGIGTGNFSVGARGELRDWEIFETSGKGNHLPNTFFAIRTQDGSSVDARVLEARIQPPFAKSHGFVDSEVAGLPRFDHSRMTAEYPFVQVTLQDPGAMVSVAMEVFNPFIPLNSDDSGLPAGILRYHVTNRTETTLAVSIMGSMQNMSTFKAYHHHTWGHYDIAGPVVNEYRDAGSFRGLFYHPETLASTDRYYGTQALVTREVATAVTHKRAWLNGGWWDGLQDVWDDFAADGRLEASSTYSCQDDPGESPDATASLCIAKTLAPGASVDFEFLLCWNFPYRVDSWSERMAQAEVQRKAGTSCGCGAAGCTPEAAPTDSSGFDLPIICKYYATKFSDAWSVASYLVDELPRLEGTSRGFREAFFGSTMPEPVLDAVSANITVLRSPTCFRLEDGTLMAWEGCFSDEGCCEGSCTHVWNYAQTLAFLFPDLERTMRRNEYLLETQEDGKMNFRSYQRFHMGPHDHVPAADGQMGTFLRLYREWLYSGDDAFLREVWPAARKTLDMAFRYWDRDGDGVLDTGLFNTYDIAFQGPTSLVNSLFLGALLAGERMASHLGDAESAARWRAAFEKGSPATDAILWDGEYYVQRVDDVDEYRYQYGRGCLSDQLFGQTLAHLVGLGYVLPADHVRTAIRSVYRYNFLTDPTGHCNLQRTYRLNDETGLLLCTWPKGGRPKLPFPYSDEVWTGIEYQVATHLAFEGAVEEAVALVAAVRARHDGIRRNPWNEVECGHHYARSMASYGLWVAFSGFRFDLPAGWISFDPKAAGDADFTCFCSTGNAWGVYRRSRDGDGTVRQSVEWLHGDPGDVTLRV